MNETTHKAKTTKAWPTPVMGLITLEVIKEDVTEYLIKKDKIQENAPTLMNSGFEVVFGDVTTDHETGGKKFNTKKTLYGEVPYKKGKVLEMAVGCYGTAFEHNYGKDVTDDMRSKVKVGSVVWFIPNQSYRIDVDGQYHMIPDEMIKAVD